MQTTLILETTRLSFTLWLEGHAAGGELGEDADGAEVVAFSPEPFYYGEDFQTLAITGSLAFADGGAAWLNTPQIEFTLYDLGPARLEVFVNCKSDRAPIEAYCLTLLDSIRRYFSVLDEIGTPTPAVISGGAGAADTETASGDEPIDQDSIPKLGRRRDLTTREVKSIVRRCKQYQAAGGSIAKFHEQESHKWPDPDDSPKSYSLSTLEKWLQRFSVIGEN